MSTTPAPAPTTSTTPATIELRGESGRLYGVLNTATGVIHIRRGNERDRVDVSAYLKAAGIKPGKDAVQ